MAIFAQYNAVGGVVCFGSYDEGEDIELVGDAVGYVVSHKFDSARDCYVKNGALVKTPTPRPSALFEWGGEGVGWVDSLSLDERRRHYFRDIDSRAESARARIITAAPGQSMTYEAKYKEALAGGGPFITAEAEALGITEQEVIDSVLAARAQWESAGKAIEAIRLKAKKEVREAGTPAEMHAVVQQLAFP